ncbi:hypothetical protein C9F11_38305 [Streptomyces sp. YIM 121038]|uniref:hypothetical protein n=1 Tax=Streptomyces sp. YIM 121038 TaxID=2136401 RepID=UPI00111056CD|nr:hypothetical protein [Streptomyces sp. YIM 121038]QCX81244.1 hypothetical protein C9F11_38305 [Streptomyces sp. YIM 121038]
MTAQYIAFNSAFGATTNTMAGTSYATGAKVAIQLATPSTLQIKIIEWGISFNGSAAATPAVCELVQNGTASTCSSAHSTTTIQPIGDNAKGSGLTMGTTSSGYGNGAITSATPDKYFEAQYISPTAQFVHQYPLGREPVVAASKYCQLRVNTSATVNAIAYVVFEEC